MASEDFYSDAARTFLRLMFDIRRLPVQKDVKELSMGENGLLFYLFNHPEGASPGGISREMKIGTGAVANVMNSLERKGYIARTMDPGDRRRVIASLSEEGHALIRERAAEMMRDTRCLLSALGEEDTGALLRIYQRILEISREELARQSSCPDTY